MTAAISTDDLTDAEFEIADRVEALLEANPAQSWTPSGVARKVRATTADAARVLAYLLANRYITAAGNGAWTRYTARG